MNVEKERESKRHILLHTYNNNVHVDSISLQLFIL